MDERASLQQQLSRTRRMVQILEQDVAGFGPLHVPAHLKLELEEAQAQRASLESRLAQLEGKRPDALPDTLLPPPQLFVGRKPEMAQCLEALAPEDRGWGVLIDGVGGMGKTALALEVAHEARRRSWFDAYLLVSAKATQLTADGIRTDTLALNSLDGFTRELARGLGDDALARTPDPAERRRGLLEALRGRRALLIFDNLETLSAADRSDIGEFLRRLPAPNKAILTSRTRAGESATTIRLASLSESEAVELMLGVGKRNARVGGELARASVALRRSLYEASGGNPLALHWILGLMALKGYTLPHALAVLSDAARSQDLYAFLFADSLAVLNPSDRTLLAALVTCYTPAPLQMLADATGLPPTTVQVALDRLVVLSLVNDLEERSYALHPLARRFVLGELNASSQAMDAAAYRKALRYWVEYGQQRGGNYNYEGHKLLEAHWLDLDAAATALHELSGLPSALRDREAAQLLNQLVRALSVFLRNLGYWSERIRICETGYAAAEALGQWSDAGWGAYDVAFTYHQRGVLDNAERWAGLMATSMAKTGNSRETMIAMSMSVLIAKQRGNLDEAERMSLSFLDDARVRQHAEDETVALTDLGGIFSRRGDYSQAETYHRQAYTLAEKDGNLYHQANSCSNIGNSFLNRNRLGEARFWYERALALAEQVGRQDVITSLQHNVALILEREGRYTEALERAEEALRIDERLRHGNLENTRALVARLRALVGGG